MNLRPVRYGIVAALASLALTPTLALAGAVPAPRSQQAPAWITSCARHAAPPSTTHNAHKTHKTHKPNKFRHSSLGRVTTRTGHLNVRSGAGTGYRVIGSLHRGASVWLAYKTHGTQVHGNRLWYELADHKGYVSARYVRNLGIVPAR
ncbi:SH3 domain-containing protein [Streptomyces sp. NPDC055400]